MTWVRLDDDFPSHRKVRRCSDAAFRVHVSGLCWSSKYLTDGHISVEDAEMIGDDLDGARDPESLRNILDELVKRGMWHPAQHNCPTCLTRDDGGWVIHDYLDMNPSAEQVQHQRKLAANRQRRARERGTATTKRGDSESPDDEEKSRRDGDVTHVPVMRESRLPTPTPTPIEKRTTFSSPPTAKKRRTRATADPDFDRFWDVYPNREAKAGAQKAWAKAIKDADPDALIAAAERLRDRPGREDRYTPHAATWLNGQRWLDEPPPTNGHRVPLNGGRHQPYHDDPTANYHAEL